MCYAYWRRRGVGKVSSRPGPSQNGPMVKNGNDHQTNHVRAPITCTKSVRVGKPAPDQIKSTKCFCRTGKDSGKDW